MTIYEFYDAIDHLDWHYPFSDDPDAFAKGQKRYDELRRECTTYVRRWLWDQMQLYHTSFDIVDGCVVKPHPKPARPL